MRILVMGAGALGGYFGARLQAAGHDVTYVARGAHLAAMREKGLRVESGAGNLVLPKVDATGDPSAVRDADVVLFMVKNYDVETAAEQVRPAIREDAIVITCQNGVSAPERLAAVIGRDRVYPGAVYMPVDVKEPGVIRHPATFHRLAFGPLEGAPSATARAFAEAVRAAGPDCEIAENIAATLWEKFVLLASLSALTCITRADIGPVRDTASTRALLRRAIEEADAVGRAECPGMAADLVERSWTFLTETAPPAMHASMLDDLTRGRRIEVNYLSGDIARRGGKHGIPTPVHSFAAAVLQPFVEGAP